MTHSKKFPFCVTFDLWETLIIDTPEKDLARREMRCRGLQQSLAEAGTDLSLEEVARAYDESAHWLQTVWRENRDTTDLEQIRFIVEAASSGEAHLPEDGGQLQRLQEAYTEPLLEVPPVLCKDSLSTLREMRELTPKIGLISNTGRSPGRTCRELMSRLGILQFFDATIFSEEIGWRKPDRRIFEATAKALKTTPDRVVHIGDHPEADVWGAKQAGMHALWLEYEVPEGFRLQPNSLLRLSHGERRIDDSEILPDGRIQSLSEALEAIKTLV